MPPPWWFVEASADMAPPLVIRAAAVTKTAVRWRTLRTLVGRSVVGPLRTTDIFVASPGVISQDMLAGRVNDSVVMQTPVYPLSGVAVNRDRRSKGQKCPWGTCALARSGVRFRG
ncbi:hypothetical protein GCM10025867_05940 [Frondihabitans sucicola]|uniref:Uncharacterized protein n=1 Tax=Frondihabitans sucicola TaxID=1268041 RepID=A0ABM8GJ13_9MICO|nr:hypothetical protein GCM10025867_05940 [Frondihabitans sucicola]